MSEANADPREVREPSVKAGHADDGDIPAIQRLQQQNLLANVGADNLRNGFVTTALTEAQLSELIGRGELLCARVQGQVIGYVVGAEWRWLKQWPIFKFMAEELPPFRFADIVVTEHNSFQYGPICIAHEWRGGETLNALYRAVSNAFAPRFKVAVTFINLKNERSLAAHTRKLGLQLIDEFPFGEHRFARLAFATQAA